MSTSHNEKDRQVLLSCFRGLLDRVDSISKACNNEIPIYAETETQWFHSSGGSWIGGYWSALWLLKAKYQYSQESLSYTHSLTAAESIVETLCSKVTADSAYRSSIFYYGICLGEKWFSEEFLTNSMSKACHQVSDLLVASFNTELGGVPLGQAMGGGLSGRSRLAVDYLPALVMFSDSITSKELSSLSDTTVNTFIVRGVTEEGCAEDMTIDVIGNVFWSRGNAWAILGLVRAYHCLGNNKALSAAIDMLALWGKRWGNSIPFNDATSDIKNRDTYCIEGKSIKTRDLNVDHQRYLDPSAAIIIALAELSIAEIYKATPNLSDRYFNSALEKVQAVITSEFVYSSSQGLIFRGSCYQTREGLNMVECPWGSFYLAATLGCILGYVHPFDV